MNKLFRIILNIKLPWLMLIVLIVATAIVFYLYITGPPSNPFITLLGGMVAGLIIVIIQFLFAWFEFKEVDKFKRLKIKRILLHRDDRIFYQQLIENAKKRILVMGVTAWRFMEHFSRDETDRPEAKVLLDALNRNVKVNILVPRAEFLPSEDEKHKANQTKNHFDRVAKKYKNFKYRYFGHVAAHSLVVVDDECLIGPCFPNIKSKDTPCIYIDASSPYAEKYLEYFDMEWKNAKK